MGWAGHPHFTALRLASRVDDGTLEGTRAGVMCAHICDKQELQKLFALIKHLHLV